MNSVMPQIHEKRIIAAFLYQFYGFIRKPVCQIFSVRTIFEIFYLIRAEISMVGMTQMASSDVDIESLAIRVIFCFTDMPYADMV